MKDDSKIISESVEAANGCLHYYSGQKLDENQKKELFGLFQKWFPNLATSENYNQIESAYQERITKENY